MTIKGKIELEDNTWTPCIIHQFGEAYGEPCAFVTGLQPFTGKVYVVLLKDVRVDE